MLQPPHTYFEWVCLIEDLKLKTNDNNSLLSCLEQGVFEPHAEIYKKLIHQFWEAVSFRLTAAIEKFQHELLLTQGKEAAFVQAYLSFRQDCAYLNNVLNIPFISEKEQKIMKDAFFKNMSSLQKTIEKNVTVFDKSGKLLTLLKNNKLTSLEQEKNE